MKKLCKIINDGSIRCNNKMHMAISETYKGYNIMSALVLRNYLYQL
ncbi:MAG: hypothetical protein LBH30_05360 [Prevotellaceae bacterium]|nr:hypothetical protein [Prevotellaceae bacterium]